jgi:hypothetical protein
LFRASGLPLLFTVTMLLGMPLGLSYRAGREEEAKLRALPSPLVEPRPRES